MADQPLKKRKVYETPPVGQSPPPPEPPPAPPQSQEENQQMQRNREEIRSVFENYKQLKQCISKKDAQSAPKLEQSYLALITASRGCTSVQRNVAKYIPKYASCCPTALEAAAKVVVHMHNCSLAVVNRGEDFDGVAFATAKFCIFGLADICKSAMSEAPTSSVIQGICSAVFLNVLTFFISSFEGKDLFQIVDKDIIIKMQDSNELFSAFKQKFSADDDESASVRLCKLRALSLLWIFFSCPKNSLVACFELLDSTVTEGNHNDGLYFLSQVTSGLEANAVDGLVSDGNQISEDSSLLLKKCLLGLVVTKDPSLRRWIVSRYKKFCKSASSQVMPIITSLLEGVFQSFAEEVKAADGQADNNFKIHETSEVSGQNLIDGRPVASLEIHLSYNIDTGGPGSMDFDSGNIGDLSRTRSSTPRDLPNNQMQSPITRNPFDLRNNSFEGYPSFESPNNHIPVSYPSTNQATWFSDGDPAAMDIFSASRLLRLGSLGPDASEALVRFQFDKFGPTDQFLYFPAKGFASVEYRNIMDAIRAREFMRGRSPWGARLHVKFMDIGLGTRGSINGVAVGSSCHVYIGNVASHWAKDEILHEIRKVIYNGPRMVTDLTSEAALLVEFENPEEATSLMAHLRQWRKQNNYGNMELIISPRINNPEFRGTPRHVFHPNWSSPFGCGAGPDGAYDNNKMVIDPSQGGANEQMWMYNNKPEMDQQHSAPPGSISYMPTATYGPPVAPPPPTQPIQSSPLMRPLYSSWNTHGGLMNHHHPLNPFSPGVVVPNNLQNHTVPPPFLPPSVTPLAQMQGGSSMQQQFDHMYSCPAAPPPLTTLPPPPPQPSPPPPLPRSLPPLVPPPPSDPFPLPPRDNSSNFQTSGPCPQPPYQWQGTLSKSGVHYCTIQAQKLHSDICKYSNTISEPAEWPAKLDMTKRTDFRHVKSTFSSTPPHKREVCQLLPSSAGDHKGFQDFISYLKQRECAGVIKIPGVKSIWARLLFILPYSLEILSMLSITPTLSPDCLIALVLPKETNFEWV